MTVVVPCSNCDGYGGVVSAYGTETCPVCDGKGYRTNTEYKPPVADDMDADAAEAFQMAKDDRAIFPASTVRKLWELKERYRRALASAPVGGEVQPVAYWLVYQDYDHKVLRFAPGAEGKPVLADGYSAMPLYAAPQANLK